ncbi:hypothetical protein M0804_009103 [Polistes exclamans]|nr:hypothetical protein M0804_009103 [Polistes exclamans]
MATCRTTLRPDLQALLDNFTQLKNVYLSLKTFSNIQDELLQYEKSKSSKMEEEMKKMTKTFTLLEEQRKKSIEEVRKENEELKKALFESREECNHLRFIYVDRNVEDEQIIYRISKGVYLVCKLQDELELLKSNLALQEERHKEEIFQLERKWPGLNVSKASKIITTDLGNEDNMDKYTSEKTTRKKKLYCEDNEAIVDI